MYTINSEMMESVTQAAAIGVCSWHWPLWREILLPTVLLFKSGNLPVPSTHIHMTQKIAILNSFTNILRLVSAPITGTMSACCSPKRWCCSLHFLCVILDIFSRLLPLCLVCHFVHHMVDPSHTLMDCSSSIRLDFHLQSDLLSSVTGYYLAKTCQSPTSTVWLLFMTTYPYWHRQYDAAVAIMSVLI